MNDLRSLLHGARRQLLLLAAAIVLSLTVGLGSTYLLNSLTRDLPELEAQVLAEQARYAKLQEDQELIAQFSEEFRSLLALGMVGPAQREDWIDQLMVTQKHLGLPANLIYRLSSSRPVSLADDTPESAASLVPAGGPVRHDLDIEIVETHEIELLDLLDDYQSRVHGRFRIQSCSFSAPSPSKGMDVRCTLRFFNLNEKQAT